MRIAVEESEQVQLDLKMLNSVLEMYEKLAESGMAEPWYAGTVSLLPERKIRFLSGIVSFF